MTKAQDAEILSSKLAAFTKTLTPGEQKLFAVMMAAARKAATDADVTGFDDGGSDGLTKVNWDAFSALAVTSTPVLDREIGSPRE